MASEAMSGCLILTFLGRGRGGRHLTITVEVDLDDLLTTDHDSRGAHEINSSAHHVLMLQLVAY